jgi:hypothetical protein
MKRRSSHHFCALLLAALPCLGSGTARAQGMNLAWNDCPLGPTTSGSRTFACNTNAGNNLLVVSFTPPPEVTSIVAMYPVIDVWSEACPVQDWWRFKYSGTCRLNALSVGTVFAPTQSGCVDPWNGAGSGTVAAYYTSTILPSLQTNQSRILAMVTVPDPLGVPVSSGTEYYVCNIVIANDKTVGGGACTGCSYGACLVLNEILLTHTTASGTSDVLITNPLYAVFATWQGGVLGCGGTDGAGHECTVPVQNHTWGQIKTLYR